MRVVSGRNVNDIYHKVVGVMRSEAKERDSRNGKVYVLDTPFCAVYDRPSEMVLFDKTRNANAAFHLSEALWMLAGRSDAAYLDSYVRDFGRRFANEMGNLDGAYGPRWRTHFGIDQISLAIDKLRANSDDRRVVIQMWDPRKDNDPSTKDACCNQQLLPRIVNGRLDLTVTCRSNDAIWGALGANACHFPFLQQYMAGRLGIEVGKFYQFSNNYHVYSEIWGKLGQPVPANLDPYARGEVEAAPIGDVWDAWDDDLAGFVDWHDRLWGTRVGDPPPRPEYANAWFGGTASPMVEAMWLYRRRGTAAALAAVEAVAASDWRVAATAWLRRIEDRRAGAPAEKSSPGDVRPA